MSGFSKPVDPVVALGQELARLKARVRDLAHASDFKIPVLAADPPVSSPFNIWLFPDGRLRARHLNTAGTAYVIREWVPTTAGSSSSATALGTPATAPKTQQSAFPAIWSRSYDQAGVQIPGDGQVDLYFGLWGSYGITRSLIGFDYAAIATALSGSTINAVRLTLQILNAREALGADGYFGLHNFTAVQTTWAGGGIPASMIYRQHLDKSTVVEFDLPLTFATALRAGTAKGIAVEAPTADTVFSGLASGYLSGYLLPTLTIDYAK